MTGCVSLDVKLNQVSRHMLKGLGALVEIPNHCQLVPGVLSLRRPGCQDTALGPSRRGPAILHWKRPDDVNTRLRCPEGCSSGYLGPLAARP